MQSRWNDDEARSFIDRYAAFGEDLALRVYTSRLLGADPSLVLHGGGNTSVKTTMTTLLGDVIEVLCVKGSGWDLETIEPPGLPAVELAYLRRLRGLEVLADEAMVNAQRTHLLDAASPNPSIETLLHAFLPAKFIDHTHADAVLAFTNQADGEARIRAVFGDEVCYVPYVKPGFDLAKLAADVHDANPGCKGMVLLHHGLFTWGDTAKESYERHIELVDRAERALATRGWHADRLPDEVALATARDRAARLAPLLRGALANRVGEGWNRWIVVHRVTPELLDFVDADDFETLALSGLLTPDHVIRTKQHPMVLKLDLAGSDADWRASADAAVAAYRDSYDAWFAEQAALAGGTYTRLDSTPRVVMVPGVGIFTVGADHKACGVAADITEHTVSVKAVSRDLGPYTALSDPRIFEIEYWSLEQAKLKKGGASAPMARRVALVTGGAGAIGVGIARALLDAGAHVVLTDISEAALTRARGMLKGGGRLLTVVADVTDEHSVADAFRAANLAFGGVDAVIPNAGVAAIAPLDALEEAEFRRVMDVNLHGTFLTIREAARALKAQGTGGDVVLISSKNVFGPGAEFAAYSASKAGAHQVARVAALELAPHGVRVNMINPDAIFAEGDVPSGLWQAVGPSRAAARGMSMADLPAFYRDRNLLKATITGEHVGKAVVFFASEQTPTTGATLPVDGGVATAFPR